MERQLTAILSADVTGYSRLMGENEEATIRTLTAYREVMATRIAQHRGRVVAVPGDNLLAEFASAVDAVQGAVAIQRDLYGKNAQLPPERRMEFRIGINVGDVVVEGERLYGEGVNIAGGISNWIDRVFRGSVVDFMNVGIGWLRTGIFNVADVAIMLGVALLLLIELSACDRPNNTLERTQDG